METSLHGQQTILKIYSKYTTIFSKIYQSYFMDKVHQYHIVGNGEIDFAPFILFLKTSTFTKAAALGAETQKPSATNFNALTLLQFTV